MVNIIMIHTPMYAANVASHPGPPMTTASPDSGCWVTQVLVKPYCTPAQMTAAIMPPR